jgi:hypothetical protein
MTLSHRGLIAAALSITALGGVATAAHAGDDGSSGSPAPATATATSTSITHPVITKVSPNPLKSGDIALVEGSCRASDTRPLDHVDVIATSYGDPSTQITVGAFVLGPRGKFVADLMPTEGEWDVTARCVFEDGTVLIATSDRPLLVRP